jgi:hypothetical protein
MTEIKIEKKKLKWPWILLLIVILAALAYFLLFSDKKEDISEEIEAPEILETIKKPDVPEVIEQVIEKKANAIVAAYVTFINSGDKMGLDHEFTSEALLKLTNATESIAGEANYVIRGNLGQVREIAAFIKVNKYDTSHADSIRAATDIITSVLGNIQMKKYPELKNNIAELRAASIVIKPAVLTLDQRVEVKAFFRKAADLLIKMN